MTNNTNGVFHYLGMHLSVMNESLLQSCDDRLRVFPALPAQEKDAKRLAPLSMTTLGIAR